MVKQHMNFKILKFPEHHTEIFLFLVSRGSRRRCFEGAISSLMSSSIWGSTRRGMGASVSCKQIRSVGMWVTIYKARRRYSNAIVIILASYSKPEENGENYRIKKQRHPYRFWEAYWWCHWWPMSGLTNMPMSFRDRCPVCPPYMCTESNPSQVMGVCWCFHKPTFVLPSSWTYHSSKGHSLRTLSKGCFILEL